MEASKKIEKAKLYDVKEAISLVKETSTTKFDSSVEVAMHLNIDTKKSDQQLRGSIVLPNGTGKSKKILVLAKGAAAEAAKKAGADFVGEQDLIDKISNENWFDYDTTTPEKTVEDIKKGMIEYRADSLGNVHSIIGKVSFDEKSLEENLTYFVNTIIKNKPKTVKGTFVKSVSICTTMGPGIKLNTNSFDK